MRVLILTTVMVLLSGCAATLTHTPTGYLPGDPCVRCGEGWTFLEPSTVPPSTAELAQHGITK